MFDAPPAPTRAPAVQQHLHFATALEAVGQSPVFLKGSDPILVLRRRLPGKIPLVMVSRSRFTDIKDQLHRIRAISGRTPVILSPDAPCPDLARHGAMPLMTPATVAEIDLTAPEDTRRALLHQKWRNRLVQAEAGPLRVSHRDMPIDPGHWLLRADEQQQARRGYRGWPTALTLAYAMQNPGKARLFTAHLDRRPVASMLFLRHGTGATYHIGHTDDDGRRHSAHTLLLWAATAWLAIKGHTRLELGLIDTGNAPGLARFKLGAGATARRMGGTWLFWPPIKRFLAPLAMLDRRRM